MKYKVGDIVKIKTWDQMEKEFSLDCDGSILVKNPNIYLYRDKETNFNKLYPNRIAEIVGAWQDPFRAHLFYILEGMPNNLWSNEMIECLSGKVAPIYSRFEILDIR